VLVGMQPRTPPGQVARCVYGHDVLAVSIMRSRYSKQFGGQLSPSASHTRSHRADKFVGVTARVSRRSLALDHGSV